MTIVGRLSLIYSRLVGISVQVKTKQIKTKHKYEAVY